MEHTNTIWPLVVALAAVVNGLGIVRLIGGLAEYLKNKSTLNIQHYWVYALLAFFQLLAHLLLWWSILGLQALSNINFLNFLYLLIGPTLLYLGTSLLTPNIKDKSINLRTEYYNVRKTFFSIMSFFWLWAIFVWPAFGYSFAPTVPLITVWLLISVVLLITDNPRVHATLVIGNCVVYAIFVAIFAIQLGEVAHNIIN